MTEHDGLTLAPVFIKDFDAVFGFDEHDVPFRNYTTAECVVPAIRFYLAARKGDDELGLVTAK